MLIKRTLDTPVLVAPKHKLLSVKLFSNVPVGILLNINHFFSVLNQQDCTRISVMKSDLNW